MKKLFTSVAFLGLTAFAASAQKNIDIQFETTVSPSTIYVGDSAWIDIIVTNNGPETLDVTDTLFYGVVGSSSAWSIIPTSPVAVGGNITLERALYYYTADQNTYAADSTREFCFNIIPQASITYSVEGGGTRPATVTYTDANVDNDKSCVTILQKAATASILNLNKNFAKLDIYPNPTANNLNFAYEFESLSNAVVKVYDITGRLVITENFGKQNIGVNNFSLDVSELSNGNYTIELSANDKKGISKFVIAK